jgi:hypothetical protein
MVLMPSRADEVLRGVVCDVYGLASIDLETFEELREPDRARLPPGAAQLMGQEDLIGVSGDPQDA